MTGRTEALGRLRAAADRARAGWLPTSWTKVGGGPRPDAYAMKPHQVWGPVGTFVPPLALPRGGRLTLQCPLHLPRSIEGVELAGDRLELTVFSLFPMELRHRATPDDPGRVLWSERMGPAAAGPVALEVIPALSPGDNGWLEMSVSAFDTQVFADWNWLHLTTPGLRARFELLDVAWAQLYLADSLAGSAQEAKAVEAAALAVPEQLVTDNSVALEAALAEMADSLAPLGEAARRLRVHLIGHSHIDLAWLWTWPDTVEVIKRDVRSVLSLMEDYPELTFTHSQPASYEVLQREEPGLFEEVQRRVAEGRWEPATVQWVEGDENLASSESAARQVLEGVAWSREELGVSPTTLLAPDTFGHAGQLPQVAVSGGARVYYHHRCNPGGEGGQWPAYWWEAQDGTRLLAVSTETYNSFISAGTVARAAVRAYEHGLTASLVVHGIGDHGGGPTRDSLDTLARLHRLPVLPEVLCSTLGAYAGEVVDDAGAVLPVYVGESRTTFEGCYTTHGDTKRFNRHGENLLLSAETVAALAGVDRRGELTRAWRRVLFNQFHDILDGSAIPEVYRDQAGDFDRVKATAEEATKAALAVLGRGATPGTIAVTNPLGFDRQDVVVVPGLTLEGPVVLEGDGGQVAVGQPTPEGLCFVADVPAFGTVGYALAGRPVGELAAARNLSVELVSGSHRGPLVSGPERGPGQFRVETPHFRAVVRADSGIVVGLLDKRVGRQLVGWGMSWPGGAGEAARPELGLNVLQVVEEAPHDMSAWVLSDVFQETALLGGATVEVAESGPVRVVLVVRHQVRSSSLAQRLVFYCDLPRIDVVTTLDWREPGNAEVGVPGLKVAFNTALDVAQAWYETPFGAASRPADGREVPALRWADLGGGDYGLAVLNESKHGHEALGSRLRLSLVRTAYDPDPSSDVGQHQFAYSLVPHPGDWRQALVPQQAAGFNQPLLARVVADGREADEADGLVGSIGWQPVVSGASSVMVSCLKPARCEGGIVIRLYEGTGRSSSVAVGNLAEGAEVWETNVVEDRLRRLRPSGGRVELDFRPWQVRTLLVEP